MLYESLKMLAVPLILFGVALYYLAEFVDRRERERRRAGLSHRPADSRRERTPESTTREDSASSRSQAGLPVAASVTHQRQVRGGITPPPAHAQSGHDPDPTLIAESYLPRSIEVVDPGYDFWVDDPANAKYPPDWEARKLAVRSRDDGRCQVPGCPSMEALHVHHVTPISQRPDHRLTNLVTLCALHHALVHPEEAVDWELKRHRFIFRRGHRRGGTWVRSHLLRRTLASAEHLTPLRDLFGLICSRCGNPDWKGALVPGQKLVKLSCEKCSWTDSFRQTLSEEVGVELARRLRATRNLGTFQDWNKHVDDYESDDALHENTNLAATTAYAGAARLVLNSAPVQPPPSSAF